jgi:hypothetical protein
MEGFLCEFITPIIKLRGKKAKSTDKELKSFFSIPEYEEYCR